VNAWNQNVIPWWLLLPQGVSGAIKKRAGLRPFLELPWRPIPLGSAVVTSAGRLPFKRIIHVASIDLFWRSSEAAIRASVASAVASASDLRSIAFPVLGSGSGGFPQDRALAIMVDELGRLPGDLRVLIVEFTDGKTRGAAGSSQQRR